jgi:hypothetical protein
MPSNLTNLSARQLRQAASIREKIDALEKQLEVVLGTTVKAPNPVPAPKAAPKKPKRKISKAARAAMSKRLKERWAKRKAAGKKAL